MSKKKPLESAEGALFVRLPADAVEKLHRAAEAMGMRKKDLVANLVSKYVDPDSPRGLHTLGSLSTRPFGMSGSTMEGGRGSYSFQPYDSPEVMTTEQAAAFLQIDEAEVLEMAEARKLPGRKLAAGWRFARVALVTWLSASGKP
jgi:hypothetical protein